MTEQERKLREQAFLDHSKGWQASLLKNAREDFEAGWAARSKVKNCLIADVGGALPTCTLLEREDVMFGKYKLTSCCKPGPVTQENYCPYCGAKIEKQ